MLGLLPLGRLPQQEVVVPGLLHRARRLLPVAVVQVVRLVSGHKVGRRVLSRVVLVPAWRVLVQVFRLPFRQTGRPLPKQGPRTVALFLPSLLVHPMWGPRRRRHQRVTPLLLRAFRLRRRVAEPTPVRQSGRHFLHPLLLGVFRDPRQVLRRFPWPLVPLS